MQEWQKPAADDASAGGAGAPPREDAANAAPEGITREYAGDGITVQWFASRCIHSGECIRALPRVFNPRRRPWVNAAAADADRIAEAVLRCPTGALRYHRSDGGAQESAESPPTVRMQPDGPWFVRGELEILDETGRVVRRETRVALCRCGKSRHMPYCDNTHAVIGFRG